MLETPHTSLCALHAPHITLHLISSHLIGTLLTSSQLFSYVIQILLKYFPFTWALLSLSHLIEALLNSRQLFCPSESFYCQREALAHNNRCAQKAFTHSKLIHREAFTHSKLLHTESFYAQKVFTHRGFYTQKAFAHSKLVHTASLYTEKPLHTASFYTQKAFTHKKLLRTEALIHSKLLHRGFYTQQAFTHRRRAHELPSIAGCSQLTRKKRDASCPGILPNTSPAFFTTSEVTTLSHGFPKSSPPKVTTSHHFPKPSHFSKSPLP